MRTATRSDDRRLLEWETIDAEQINDIMAGKPPRPPKPGSGFPAKPEEKAAEAAPAEPTSTPAQEL
jgi:cell division protease FtsH